MKKTIWLFVGMSLLICTTNAQNTFPTSGNVGVGTTTPADQFVAEKAAVGTSYTFVPRITAKTTASNESVRLGFEENAVNGGHSRVYFNVSTERGIYSNSGFVNQLDGANQWFFGMSNDGQYGGSAGTSGGRYMGYYDYLTGGWRYGFNASGELYLGASNNNYGVKLSPSGNSAFMGGNVGIGTTPTAKLHVQGGQPGNVTALANQVCFSKFNYLASDGNTMGLAFKSLKEVAATDWQTSGVRISSTIDGEHYALDHLYNNMAWIDFYGQGYTNGLRFGTNNTERMKIDANGNVGIGTAAPQYKLQVEDGTIATKSAGAMFLGQAVPNYDSYIQIHRSGYQDWLLKSPSNSIDFQILNGSNIAMHIAGNSGNIGIGTTTPGAYKLAVNGDIAAKKVKVTQIGWPDYVFEPTYRLLSLELTEAFISQHKHLPEVPSAKQVVEDGIDLGDNQVALLKKVEELTLYVIQLNKMVKEQALLLQKYRAEQLKIKK